MKVLFRSSFHRDLKKVQEKGILLKVKECIIQAENAKSIADIPGIKKMSGSKGYHRIRVQEYRVGVFIFGDRIEFVCFLHRREVYKYFP